MTGSWVELGMGTRILYRVWRDGEGIYILRLRVLVGLQ